MKLESSQKVKRGEIYLYDFGNNEGSIQNGIRPVLVIQCDKGNQASTTTIIAAFTTAIKKTVFTFPHCCWKKIWLERAFNGYA